MGSGFVVFFSLVYLYIYIYIHLRMLRVRRMTRVLRRLRQLRHVDVVLGPLRVPRVDVAAGDPTGLLQWVVSESMDVKKREEIG